MPTYQYRCTHCQHELEVVQKFTDSALTVCPSCEGELRKIYNAVGVVFKGSGFYKTDSRSSGTGAKENGSSSASKDSGASKESGSSSTPASSSSSSSSKDSGSSSSSAPAKSGTSSSSS